MTKACRQMFKLHFTPTHHIFFQVNKIENLRDHVHGENIFRTLANLFKANSMVNCRFVVRRQQ